LEAFRNMSLRSACFIHEAFFLVIRTEDYVHTTILK
jgi:hypothetical protein